MLLNLKMRLPDIAVVSYMDTRRHVSKRSLTDEAEGSIEDKGKVVPMLLN
jgi:hypothetical protein